MKLKAIDHCGQDEWRENSLSNNITDLGRVASAKGNLNAKKI